MNDAPPQNLDIADEENKLLDILKSKNATQDKGNVNLEAIADLVREVISSLRQWTLKSFPAANAADEECMINKT